MATIQGLTKDRMLEIEAAAIVSAAVNTNSHLILTKHDGTTIDSGSIQVYGATNIRQTVKNQTGATLTKGTVVYISGSTGTNALVSKSQANAEATSSKTLGLLVDDIANGSIGEVMTEGLISNINTSAATAGDSVWLSPTTAGGYVFGLANKPTSPNHMVYLGLVVRVSATVGEIYIKVQNGFELDEIHDVSIVSKQDGDVLEYDSVSGTWKNIQLGTASSKNIPATGNASTTEVVYGTDTRLTNTRNTPNSLTLRFDSGITTGTDAFSFNGSAAVPIIINAGTGITLSKGAGTGVITINNSSAVVPASTGTNDMLYAPAPGSWARFAPGTGVFTALGTAVTGSGSIALSASPTFSGVATVPSFNVTTPYYTNTVTVKTAAATLTAAELSGGILQITPVAIISLTLPLATTLDTGFASMPSGSCIDWWGINTTSFTVSIVANTGHTIIGSAVFTSTSAHFRTRKNATSSYTTYRL